jgi:alanine-glyoxylate transaminase/serine-glyoxylate transaminase/serine-pyruvate transaminase
MLKLDNHPSGRHFLHIPGPSPVPSRILRAISYQTIDHRGPEFGVFGLELLKKIRLLFKSDDPVIIYPASGTGAWEAALVNTLNHGDTVLMYESGHFASLWQRLAQRMGLKTEFISKPGLAGWRGGVDAKAIEERLKADPNHIIKAVCVVHNETSTGVTSDIAAVRAAMNAANHPALLMVDTISGLGSANYEHSAWGVDVTVSGSQKGLMLPPGLSFNTISQKAINASKTATLPKAFWAWDEILEANKTGYFPTTPATNLLYGLSEAIDMILEEGLDHIFARHQKLGLACRAAVEAWGLEILCQDPSVYSPVVTSVLVPDSIDADALRKLIHEKYNLSLGTGLGKLKGKVFRIGHLGDCNELSLLAALSGCEMGLAAYGYIPKASGVVAAQNILR